MAKLHRIVESHWQHPKPLLGLLLRPLSALFAFFVRLRRARFLSGKTPREKLAVPVVVVGNIHVGGTGKTPVVAALVSALQQKGFQTGIISRGYGRKSREVCVLNRQSNTDEAGDEPLLLFRQTGVPVAVGSKRVEAGKALLAAYPDLDVIVADDGLQHYALARDMEIAVFPSADVGRKDLDLMPNGGLREPLERLDSVDAVVVSGKGAGAGVLNVRVKQFASCLGTGRIYRLNRPQEQLDNACLKNAKTVAVAGIAKPQRFFDTLRDMGMVLDETVALPDHADISAFDFPDADVILITEKDAVKLSDRYLENVWVLPVCAIIEPDLADWVIRFLNLSNREKTI